MSHAKSAVAAAALLVASALAHAAPPSYRVKELGPTPHGWASQALAINDDNVVVGWVQVEHWGPHVAAMWSADGKLQLLGTPGSDAESFATAVNRAGQVAGYSGTGGSSQAFFWDAASGFTPLGGLDPAQPSSAAQGLGEDGLVVGWSTTASGDTHAFTWTAAGGLVDPYPTQGYATAYGVNRQGQWTGGVWDAAETQQVALRVNAGGKVTNLGTIVPEMPYAYGKALNDAGQVVGSAGAPDGSNHPFVWDKLHGMQDLGLLPGGTFGNALAVNDKGQIVGVTDTPQGRGTVDTPFYYDPRNGMRALGDLVAAGDPLKGLVQFDAAQAINERGIIVANGMRGNKYRAYLLIPVN